MPGNRRLLARARYLPVPCWQVGPAKPGGQVQKPVGSLRWPPFQQRKGVSAKIKRNGKFGHCDFVFHHIIIRRIHLLRHTVFIRHIPPAAPPLHTVYVVLP